ncbi:MAG: ribosome alternative rescue factor ArfA [Eikenella sp.]|nr:ribosome alternative rescue factor ArfA [Eikenella sp.]
MPKRTQINKGPIRDNALKALVKSNLFRPKIQKPKKGKGAYSRKGRQPSGFLIPSKNLIFLWG